MTVFAKVIAVSESYSSIACCCLSVSEIRIPLFIIVIFCVVLRGGGGRLVRAAAGIDAGATGDAGGILPHLLALTQPFFFGMSTWRMEAHVTRHPGQALPLTAGQVVVVGVSSALWGILGGGKTGAQQYQ